MPSTLEARALSQGTRAAHAARSMRPTSLVGALLAAGFSLLVGCRSVTPPGAFLDTDPPGAEVLVDGRRSGYVTPCLVHLDPSERHRVRFELPGFAPRELVLEPSRRIEEVRWRDGASSENGMRSAFGLGAADLFVPYRVDRAHAPSRIFLRLEPAASAGAGTPPARP